MVTLRIVLMAVWLCSSSLAYEEGDACSTKTDEDGTCKKLTDCPSSNALILQKKPAREISRLYTRCGFSGRYELICCSDKDVAVISRVSGQKAVQECKKYIDTLPPLIEPVTLHIFHGDPAEEAEFPHMVALGVGTEFECGGTLLSNRYVLTAAHCVEKLNNIPPTKARMGVTVLSQGTEDNDYGIEKITTHPDYSRLVKYHDLALIKLDRDVEFTSYKRPACLYGDSTDPSPSMGEITVSGWGTTESGNTKMSDQLLRAKMKISSSTECHQRYTQPPSRRLPNGITTAQLCARGAVNNSDACQGDSGGPIQVYDAANKVYRLIGVTSFGKACGSNTPGVYVRVSNYLSWIESIVWP